MIIQIIGRLGEPLTIPERAEVVVGEMVQWSIAVIGGGRPIRSVKWEFYFEGRSPFPRRTYSVTTGIQVPRGRPSTVQEIAYIATIDAGHASGPGEYKYGVRAIDEATEHALSDDDPYIVVRPW
jgi:hypothetical protein